MNSQVNRRFKGIPVAQAVQEDRITLVEQQLETPAQIPVERTAPDFYVVEWVSIKQLQRHPNVPYQNPEPEIYESLRAQLLDRTLSFRAVRAAPFGGVEPMGEIRVYPLEPLWVIKHPRGYWVVEGWDRKRAAEEIAGGDAKLPCWTLPEGTKPETALKIAIQKNLTRKEFPPYYKTRLLALFLEISNQSLDFLCGQTRIKKRYAEELIKVSTQLISVLKAIWARGDLDTRIARELTRLPEDQQLEAYNRIKPVILDQGVTEARKYARELVSRMLKPKPEEEEEKPKPIFLWEGILALIDAPLDRFWESILECLEAITRPYPICDFCGVRIQQPSPEPNLCSGCFEAKERYAPGIKITRETYDKFALLSESWTRDLVSRMERYDIPKVDRDELFVKAVNAAYFAKKSGKDLTPAGALNLALGNKPVSGIVEIFHGKLELDLDRSRWIRENWGEILRVLNLDPKIRIGQLLSDLARAGLIAIARRAGFDWSVELSWDDIVCRLISHGIVEVRDGGYHLNTPIRELRQSLIREWQSFYQQP